MSKISELSDGGNIQDGDTLIAVRSGGNVKVTYGTYNVTFGTVTADGLTVDGNVGIGTSSPTEKLHVNGDALIGSAGPDANLYLFKRFDGTGALKFQRNTAGLPIDASVSCDGNENLVLDWNLDGLNAACLFKSDSTERMRIDSSGNVGIGTASPASALEVADDSVSTVKIRANGLRVGSVNVGNGYMSFGFDNAGGATERLRIDDSGNLLVGTTTAATGSSSRSLTVNSNGIKMFLGGGIVAREGQAGLVFTGSDVVPVYNGGGADNGVDLGSVSFRFRDIHATNGTIQTSDANEKQNIEELSEAERRVAVACKGLLRKFRWKSSVEEKGDDARIHFGIIAQDLQAAFDAEGLDAGRYAMFISESWTDEETGEERTRLGVRYSELLAFIIAAI